jgi:hypothetical protein
VDTPRACRDVLLNATQPQPRRTRSAAQHTTTLPSVPTLLEKTMAWSDYCEGERPLREVFKGWILRLRRRSVDAQPRGAQTGSRREREKGGLGGGRLQRGAIGVCRFLAL